MKLQLISDTHGLSVNQIYIDKDADLIVHVGDLSDVFDLEKFIDFDNKMIEIDKDYVIVLGNHDYYNKSRTEVLSILEEFRIPVLTADNPIERDSGIVLIGDTLFSYISPLYHNVIQNSINDFRYIKNWNVFEHNKEFERQYHLIKSSIEKYINTDKKIIVVTHFPPSNLCIQDKFKGNILNEYFINDLPLLDEINKPITWLSGHTHCTTNVKHNQTDIHINAYGYRFENPKFNENYSIEI